MKNKYQRMTKEEQKKLYKEYKEQKQELTKKMERLLLFCKIGIVYSIIAVIYDLVLTTNISMGIIDGIILLFSIAMLIKTNNTKVELLNDYAIKKEKEYKKEIVKKHTKKSTK